MAQELKRESQVASDAAAQLQQGRDIAAAQDAAKAAAAAALAHYNSADQKAKDARAKAVEARDAADRAVRARTDSGEADTQATAAETAATEAEMARADAWTAVAAADAASMSAMDATTLTGAQMYQEAADAAKDAAEEQATGAGMNYMTAMEAAAAAETAAGTHVLGLFMSANAYDVKGRRRKRAEEEVASVGAAIAAAATGDSWRQPSRRRHRYCCVGCRHASRRRPPTQMPGLLKITFTSGVTGGSAAMTRSPPTQWACPTPTPASNPMPSRPTWVAISRTCSTFRKKARVCWSSPTRSRTRQGLWVTAVTVVNAKSLAAWAELSLWVSPVMVGQASRVASTMMMVWRRYSRD